MKIWFQNRRAKERKHMKKRDELLQKEKLDVAANIHAAAAAAHHGQGAAAAAAASHMFAMPPATAAAVGHMLHHGIGGPHHL